MGLTLFNLIVERENRLADNFSELFENVIQNYCIYEAENNRAYHINALEKYISSQFNNDLPLDLYESILDYITETNIDIDMFLEMLGIYMNRSIDPRYAEQSASRDKDYKQQLNKKDMQSVNTHTNIAYDKYNNFGAIYPNRSVDAKYAGQGRGKSTKSAAVIPLKNKLTPTAMGGLKKQIATGVAKYKAA